MYSEKQPTVKTYLIMKLEVSPLHWLIDRKKSQLAVRKKRHWNRGQVKTKFERLIRQFLEDT